MDRNEIDSYLTSIYFDPNNPATFGGVDKVYRYVKSKKKAISRGQIQKWLSAQSVYTKNKPVRRTFKRPRVIVPRKFYQIDGDTANMTRYDKYNGGYKYFVVLIDVLSRFAWTYPLTNLTGKSMVKALKSILTSKAEHLRTDSGSEFINVDVKRFLKSKRIDFFRTTNEKKANFAERLIKTIKTKLIKHMQYNNDFEWVKALPQITASYNSGFHRSIKMTPEQALKTSDPDLWNIQYNFNQRDKKIKPLAPPKPKNPFKFAIGDRVKLASMKGLMDREYNERWTDEYFVIIDRTNKQNIAQYIIKDYANDPVKGTFYTEELQKIVATNDTDEEYKIEKIIKRRKRGGKGEVLVKWLGWHKKFNSWIEESVVKEL